MVNKENASRLLSVSSIMSASLNVILIMFIAITVIITSIKEVLLIMAYKLQDLCTTYRQLLHATSKLKLVNMLLLIYVQVFREFEMDKICSINVFDSAQVLHSSNIIYYICHVADIFHVPKSYYYSQGFKIKLLPIIMFWCNSNMYIYFI